jgi:formyl-CoA transferase
MARTPASYRLAPPQFAEHTAEILSEIALDGEKYRDVLPGYDGDAPAKVKTA